jgi:meso-butanediol dehydrogenase/(S,S)-butanediol dehydrogenase/diacetyl reductase
VGLRLSHDVSEKLWDASITLTLKSVYLMSKAILPHMMERKQGVIVNIASVNGQSGIGEEAYSAAKAGVINLTQNMAVRYGPYGVRAVCIAPGTIETHLWKQRLANNPKTLENLKKYYPLGRIGQGRDVANAAYFLASPEASWITGTTLNVDGGLMAGSSQLQKDLMGE